MAFSLKKGGKRISGINSNGHDERKTLGEVLHHSTKNESKNKKDQPVVDRKEEIPVADNEPSLPDENLIIYRNQCTCEGHYVKQLLQRNYQLSVDKLYDLIFGSNEFVRTYRKVQRFYDETVSEWMLNESTNHQERTLKYKVPYESTFIGKGTILTSEKQILHLEVPGSHYTMEVEVSNEGVKFCDTFSLLIRYCLVQTSAITTNLRVTAQVIYHKSVNRFIKEIIERNAYSASQEGLKDLNNRLSLIQDFQMSKYKKIEIFNLYLLEDKRRLSETTAPVIEPIHRISEHSVQQPLSNESDVNNRSSDSDKLLHILVFLVIILCFFHGYLFIRLERTDTLLEKLTELL